MAKSQYEYVKNFEVHNTVLPSTYIVVRLDGRGFTLFARDHDFLKPNDPRALNLMTTAAQHICKTNQQIIMAYGQSDEYSIVFHKSCDLYNRRAEKILSVIVSSFTSAYVFYWSKFYDIPLQYPPCFDGRVICYPTEEILIDYFRWRQADCHVNNLYNTTFCALVKSGLSEHQAHTRLKGTTSADKNNILFEEFGINYNNEDSMYKKGTVLLRPNFEATHSDIFKRDFYERHQIFEKKFKVV